MDELGSTSFRKSGLGMTDPCRARSAAKKIGVTSAVVPETFPVWLADHLRASGIELTVDRTSLTTGVRRTTPSSPGMRRAQRAAEAAMDAARVSCCTPRYERRAHGREVKGAMNIVFAEHGTSCDDFIVAPGRRVPLATTWARPDHGGVPSSSTSGRATTRRTVYRRRPDVRRRRCPGQRAHLARTLQGGARPRDLRDQGGRERKDIFNGTCEIFEAAGGGRRGRRRTGCRSRTASSTGSGTVSGSRCTKSGRLIAESPLRAGDVVTVEPGLYRARYGGVRLEVPRARHRDGAEPHGYPYDPRP